MATTSLHITAAELRHLADNLSGKYRGDFPLVIVADEKRICLVEPIPPEKENPDSPTEVGQVIRYMPR